MDIVKDLLLANERGIATPQEQTQDTSTTSPDESPAVVGIEPAHWYLENEDEYMSETLRKEHERLNSYTFKLCKVAHPLYSAATVERLQAEVAELRKDAERYRWLREFAHTCSCAPDHINACVSLKSDWADGASSSDMLDAAIDAAMGEKK